MGKIIGFLIIFSFIVTFFIGYIVNIIKLCRCDFEAPYKAEVLRGIGIGFPPAGSIIGYLNVGR